MVTALANCLQSMVHVVTLIAAFIIMISIFGVQLYNGVLRLKCVAVPDGFDTTVSAWEWRGGNNSEYVRCIAGASCDGGRGAYRYGSHGSFSGVVADLGSNTIKNTM
jgi:hypothetical protein